MVPLLPVLDVVQVQILASYIGNEYSNELPPNLIVQVTDVCDRIKRSYWLSL